MTDKAPPKSTLKKMQLLAWGLVVMAIAGLILLLMVGRPSANREQATSGPVKASFGGPFTLIDAEGKRFSSQALEGKPYALYFGFTRCGDVCPTTLSRLAKLRREAANDQALNIVFITIDPANDGPKEVGQYATLFAAPIIGLTGSKAQIDQVKKQFGIFAEPVQNAPMGKQMMHSATVLLFDRSGEPAGTISPGDSDADALAKMKKLVG